MKNLKLVIAALMLLTGTWMQVNAETRTVTFSGEHTNFATKEDVTFTGVGIGNNSAGITCLNSSNVNYSRFDNTTDYMQFTVGEGEKIDEIEIIWRSGAVAQTLPVVFGETIGVSDSPSSGTISVTNGGYSSLYMGDNTVSGANNCAEESNKTISFPSNANVKAILLARLIGSISIEGANVVNETFSARLNSGGTSVGTGSTIYIGSIKLTISTIVNCTPAAVSFDIPEELTKSLGDEPFINAFTSNNTSDKVYASSDKAVATVDASTGEVTILAIGETIISVTQAADDTYCAVDTSYTLTVEAPIATYTITPSSNNVELGTVSIEGTVITAVPGTCSEYANPAYTVTARTATVSQNGNTFVVIATTNCAVTINFATKPVYTVTLDPGSGRIAGDVISLSQADCTTPVTLPAPLSCANDWVFAGWATAAVEETTTAQELIPAGSYMPEENITLYAVYSFTETNDTETVLFNEQFTGQTATEGSTSSGVTFDESWTRSTGTLYYTEVNAITLRNNVKYYTSSLDLRNPETFIEFKAKYETAPTYNAEAIARSAICVNDNSTNTNNGFQFEIQSDNSILFKKSNSGVTGDPVFLSETQLTEEFQTFKVKINGSYVNAELDGTDNIAIRVANTNSIPLVIGSFKVYTFLSTTTYSSSPECSPCTPPTSGAFAEESISKTLGDDPFTNAFTPGGENTSAVVYESSDEAVATVNATTGEVTILATGETTIKATQAEDDTYCETKASYVLTVNDPTYAITAQSNNTDYGTVVLNENKITALPVKGYQLADPAYQITPENAATVAKSGNVFTVTAIADVSVTILFEALPAPLTWNFSDTEFEAKNYDTETVVDGLTLGARTTLEANNKSLDGYNFTHRFKLNGSGSKTDRFVSFPVTGDTTITIYGMSASSDNERTLNVVAGETVIGTFVNSAVAGALGKGSVNYKGGAATIYLYSASSGFNLYAINLTAPVTYNFTAQSNNTVYGTVTAEGNVITAVPAAGYRIAIDNPFSIDPEGSATVTQTENLFTVTDLTADCTITIYFELNTGIDAINRSGLKVQRNNRNISLVSDSADPIRQIMIYDMQGRLIHARQVNAASYTIREDITPAGVYVVKVFTRNTIQNIKLLK
jgi:hypothetical protein